MPDEKETGPRLRVLPGERPSTTGPLSGPYARGERDAAHRDEALLAAFLVGDDDAFGDLVRRHQDLVLRIVRRYARTPEDARDLAQRTFVRAYEAARRVLAHGRDNALPFRRWLVRIAVNLAKNHLRDETRFTRVPLDGLPTPAASGARADDALARAEAARRMRAAVLALPRRQREVLTLRVDAELPFAEIAASLGITENAAKVSFHKAARNLRALVEEDPQ